MRIGLGKILVGLGITALLCAACGSGVPTGEPPLGSSEFVSAAGSQGSPTEKGGEGEYGAAPAADDSGNQGRTVEEGDIYRVLGPNRLVNLNSYRGLQVIDLTDAGAPRIMGRVAVSGYPVEMYVVGERAYVLLNNWYGYYGSRTDVAVQPYQGGLVLAINISDPANPVITGRAQVPGSIQTSRLTRGGGKEALFVAANNWNGETKTVVRSFAVSSAGKLEERTTLDLGGYVIDVQATPEALLVARYDWNNSNSGSLVGLINISDPEGTMVEGASVSAAGYVKSKTNMALDGNILKIASGGQWSGGGANYVETFNVADINNPLPIDRFSFGDGQDLYATIFLPGKAFCVTYHRVDPFHAFEIGAEGFITQRSEFVVSGWNDFFSAVYGDTRLIGIGMDDTNGRKLSASLYDISSLTNPNPLINRASIEFDYSWSEAQWDNRAFSVLEDAVVASAADGTIETGLVLLPFTGYSTNLSRYQAGVQIFTFSTTTLTKRGVMDHGTQVRRSFMQRDGVTANLSEQKLSLFDTTAPDAPAQLGTLDLAPNYMDFYVFGSYGARLKYDVDYYSWWGAYATTLPDNQLQIIPLDADPDLATPVATIDLPAYAQLFQVGNLAVAVTTTYIENTDPAQYSSEVRVFDLADPANPVERGSLSTNQIQPSYGYYYGWYGDCWDCGRYWYYGNLEAQVAGSTLVFPSRQWNNELLGTEHICYSYPESYGNSCWDANGYVAGCSYLSGTITCRRLNGGPETCQGEIQSCTYGADGQWSCAKVDEGSVALQTSCYDQEKRRYWSYLTLAPLVLSDPDAPEMSATLSMPDTEDDTSLLASGTGLYVTYRVPISVPGDGRDYVRYYFKKVDFANPLNPTVGSPVNIPGELILVDGATVYTRDFVWGQNIVESALNRLTVVGSHAYLQARRRFVDQNVNTMLLDGAGHALVSHSLSWYADNTTGAEQGTRLSILDLVGTDFPKLSEVAVDSWATLQEAKVGRALFTVPGGLLVLNVQNPSAPVPQAYFAMQGWPTRLVVANNDIFMPAGSYGVYRFDIDSYNLITADQ